MIHFTTADGLPSNTVYNIFIDSKGFLWIATDKGIAIYNGIRFEKFTTYDGLADNEIFFFKEDPLGRIWMATYNGELCYYQNDSFHTAQNTPYLTLKFTHSSTQAISVQYDSSLTFLYSDLQFVNIKNNKLNIYSLYNLNHVQDVNHNILQIIKFPDGNYQLIFANKILTINNASIIKEIKLTNNNNKCVSLMNSDYAYSKDSFFYYDKVIKKFFGGHIPEKKVKLFSDGNNYYEIGDTGLLINGEVKIDLHDHITAIWQDRIQGYWISTLNNGIFYLNNNSKKIKRIDNIYTGKIKYVSILDSNIFFATSYNRLFQFANCKARCLWDYKNYRVPHIDHYEPYFFLGNHYKCFIFFDAINLVCDDVRRPRKIIKYKAYFNRLSAKNILQKGNSLYVTSGVWLTKYNYDTYKENDEIHNKSVTCNDTFKTLRIYSTAIDKDSTIWYSTINNVYKLVNDSSVLQKQLKNIAFRTFDFFGNYLVGYTHENLLLVCSNINGNMIVDTIPYQNCIWEKLYKLDSAHVLISTNNFYRILTLKREGVTKKFPITTVENPLLPSDPEAVVCDSAQSYFFKDGSITIANKDGILFHPEPPQLFLKYLKIGNQRLQAQNKLTLPFNDYKNISIYFSALAFMGKEVSYLYSISRNNQENWRETESEEINLTNPTYGTYHIKLKAKTLSSSYCFPVEFILEIKSPFWVQWWFISITALCALTTIFLLARARVMWAIRNKEKKHNDEVKYIRSEFKAQNALMNPHFIFNTINNVQSLYNDDKKRSANEYLRMFADLIRQNMQNLTKEQITLQKEIDLIDNYLRLEKLRFEDNIDFTIDIDPALDLEEIMIPPLLLQPLVENSIKHGILPSENSKGDIIVRVKREAGNIVISIMDDGVGLDDTKHKTDVLYESYGLENVRQRLAQLNILQDNKITFDMGDIHDKDGKRWTTITITIPDS